MILKERLMDIRVIRDVLEESNACANDNRAAFDRHGVFVVNLMSSPGSGKTTLLEKTIPLLKERDISCAVIEGDVASTLDSERLAPLGIPVIQANTEPFGGDCHVGSHLVQAALQYLDLSSIQILFIENIGNLVCPAEFDLGEDRKVMMLSVTEGEDKPFKYPLMFRESHVCLISKVDLAPHLDTDLDLLTSNITKVNGEIHIFPISAKTGNGLSAWVEWLMNERSDYR
jgi:hydrogenase nickel incorporation protein HypB